MYVYMWTVLYIYTHYIIIVRTSHGPLQDRGKEEGEEEEEEEEPEEVSKSTSSLFKVTTY